MAANEQQAAVDAHGPRVVPPTARLALFDHVRYLVIVWVVLFHVSAGLCGFPEFIQDADSSIVFAVFNGFSVTVMMSIMFFLAGYFARPSLSRHGSRGFVERKLGRLGLPWLVGVLLLGPIMPYLAYYSRSFAGLSSDGYADFWWRYVSSGWHSWYLPVSFTANLRFHHQHFWFLSQLLLFMIVYALVRGQRRGEPVPAGGAAAISGCRSPAEFVRPLLWVAVVGGLGLGISSLLGLRGGVLAFVFSVDPSVLGLYAGVFMLGSHAQARGWYVDGRMPRWRSAVALLAVMLAAGALAAVIRVGLGADSSLFFPALLLGVAPVNLLMLILVLGLAARYLNRPSRFSSRLAADSFGVYLVQYPVILGCHLLVFTWAASPYLKFVLIAVPALLISYGLSAVVIRRRPALAVLAALGLNLALAVVGLPRTAFSHVLLDRLDRLHAVVPADRHPQPLLEAMEGTKWFAWDTAALVWRDGWLYHAGRGFRILSAQGWRCVATENKLSALTSLQARGLAGVRGSRIVTLDQSGELQGPLCVADSTWTPGFLVGVPGQGIYCDHGSGRPGLSYVPFHGAVQHRTLPLRGAGALSASGDTLLWTSSSEPWIYAMPVLASGVLGDAQRRAEIFLADGRYGRPRRTPVRQSVTDMAVDRNGRLLLVSPVGLQVLDASGEVLGVVALPPDVCACTFGGVDGSTLFLASADAVYALQTATVGAGVAAIDTPPGEP